MTNGEKFKEIFQISQVDEGELYAYVWLPNHDAAEISIDWWNAEYKEPTTKNDLGVDCIARQDVERYIEGFINEYTPKEELEFINLELDGLKHLPPVIPQELKTGRWITRPHVYGVTYCSECDFELKIDNTNYCPNCGAKMVKPQESEG